MDGTGVDAIARLAPKPSAFLIGGRNYIVVPKADGGFTFLGDKGTQEGGPLLALPQEQPAIPTLLIHTLLGLSDYVQAAVADVEGKASPHLDHLDVHKLAVHVVSHGTVDLLTKLEEDYPQRHTVARVSLPEVVGFKFGQFLQLEAFVIGLLTMFVDTPARADVLRVIGNIKDEKVATVGDDGVSQEVTLRAGVVRAGCAVVPNPVKLAPFRTFRELVQPESLFLLRVRPGKTEGELPTVALFEADGGAWKLEAIKGIRDYLTQRLPASLPVLA